VIIIEKIGGENLKKEKPTMTLIDADTGQIHENISTIVTKKQDEYFKDWWKTSKENKEFVEQYGNFIFKTNSKKVDKLEDKISGVDITKLIYCATYLNYNNVLQLDNGEIINKKKLKELINVDENKWYNSMIKLNILIEENNKNIKISKNYCIRGKLVKNKRYSRIFINSVRRLYENNKGKNMTSLGNIIKLLPYINPLLNILCTNPNETDIDEINPLTLKEISEIFGYTGDNCFKIINKINKYKLESGEPIVMFMNDNDSKRNDFLIFNPSLTYSANINEDTMASIFRLRGIFNKNKNKKIDKNFKTLKSLRNTK